MPGAPISTTVIVFELTGGDALSIALLLTVAIALRGFDTGGHRQLPVVAEAALAAFPAGPNSWRR